MAAKGSSTKTTQTETEDTEVEVKTGIPAQEESQQAKPAGSLKEALYGNAEAEAKAAEEQTEAQQTAYQEAAQAELDAQQADRDAGYATSAEEGPSKPKPVEDAGDADAANADARRLTQFFAYNYPTPFDTAVISNLTLAAGLLFLLALILAVILIALVVSATD